MFRPRFESSTITSGQTAEKTSPLTVPLLLAHFPSVHVCVSTISLLDNGPFARQCLAKYVSAATNTHAKIELLDASFSMESVSYQSKVGD
jgi:hypothetical protein